MKAEEIGRFIREERTNIGMSQKALADLVHVSVKTISKWETGNGYPNIAVLQDLAKALHTSTDRLLKGSHFPEKRDPRLDYENTDNPLQPTDFEGIWNVKPFHSMESAIKNALPIALQVMNKQTKAIVLNLENCVSCWQGINGWKNSKTNELIVNNDIAIITSDYKEYIIKHDLYNVVNPKSLKFI